MDGIYPIRLDRQAICRDPCWVASEDEHGRPGRDHSISATSGKQALEQIWGSQACKIATHIPETRSSSKAPDKQPIDIHTDPS